MKNKKVSRSKRRVKNGPRRNLKNRKNLKREKEPVSYQDFYGPPRSDQDEYYLRG